MYLLLCMLLYGGGRFKVVVDLRCEELRGGETARRQEYNGARSGIKWRHNIALGIMT
jgi:hypothetical protein